MDLLTHALIAMMLLSIMGMPGLNAYAIAGTVIIDLDIFLSLFSDKDPRLYIFTHGGFTHGVLGASVMTLLASLPAFLLSSGPFEGILPPFGITAFAAIWLGALTHILTDYLAYPGIPLLYPISDKKHTLGVFGGPNPLIMLSSLAYLLLAQAGMASIGQPWAYIAIFSAIIALCAAAKTAAALKTKGRTIATSNPFKWLIIENSMDTYRFYVYRFFSKTSPIIYKKYVGITQAQAKEYENRPDVKRLKYHSYIVTVEKDGDAIKFRDPLRENGIIRYPPYYKSAIVQL